MQEPHVDQPRIKQEEIINNLTAVGTIVTKNTAAETAASLKHKLSRAKNNIYNVVQER